MAANKPVFTASNKPPQSQEGRLQASQERELGRVLTDVRKIKDGRIAGAFALPSVPTGGTFAQGDVVRNSNPSLTLSGTDQYFIHGWEYVSEGSGTLTWMPIKIWSVESGGITSATLTATNVGTGKGVYLGESGGILQFRTLKADATGNVTISTSGNELAFGLTFTPFTAASQSATNVGAGSGMYLNNTGGILQFRTLKAGVNASLSTSGNEVVMMGPSGLTTGRVPYATTGGSLVDTSSFRWDSANLGLAIAASGSVNSTMRLHVGDTTNGALQIGITNGSNGNGAFCGYYAINDSGNNFQLLKTGSAFTPVGLKLAEQGLLFANAGPILIGTNGAADVVFCTGGSAATNERGRLYANGDVQLGTNSLTVSSSVGFVHIPSVAGAPVAAPVLHTGYVPMCYDRTNNHFYIYNGGWKKTTVFA